MYHIDLVETDYFGLQFMDTDQVSVSNLLLLSVLAETSLTHTRCLGCFSFFSTGWTCPSSLRSRFGVGPTFCFYYLGNSVGEQVAQGEILAQGLAVALMAVPLFVLRLVTGINDFLRVCTHMCVSVCCKCLQKETVARNKGECPW